MKVQIAHTLQVTDEQLVQMANLADDKRTKRRAKRDEVKDYVWRYGADWATSLDEEWADVFGAGDPMAGAAGAKADATVADDDLEDLLGTPAGGSTPGADADAEADLEDLL